MWKGVVEVKVSNLNKIHSALASAPAPAVAVAVSALAVSAVGSVSNHVSDGK